MEIAELSAGSLFLHTFDVKADKRNLLLADQSLTGGGIVSAPLTEVGQVDVPLVRNLSA